MFCSNREILFHLIHNCHMCKITSLIFFSFQKSNRECALVGIRFYTGDCKLDKTISPCFLETRDTDSMIGCSFSISSSLHLSFKWEVIWCSLLYIRTASSIFNHLIMAWILIYLFIYLFWLCWPYGLPI